MKLLSRILLILLVLLVITAIAGYFGLQYQKPSYEGTVSLPGLNKRVDVWYDEFGIPHIYAENEVDAHYALGYVHAQDRLFQMELIRRVSRGELAEVLGPNLAKTDRFYRTIGIGETAKKAAEVFLEKDDNDPVKKAALAYLEGVNAFMQQGPSPIEFHILDIPLRPFTIEDTYSIFGYMAFSFAQAFRTDPLLQRILDRHGSDYLNDLDVHWHPKAEKIPVWGRNAQTKTTTNGFDINQLFNTLPVPPWIGSNSWVIGPLKTKSGKVILSNDTHMGFAQPSVWYEAHIECPEVSLYGNYLAGVPFAIIGHNRYMSIGLTMFENDDMDFYVEKVNPDNPNQFWFINQWEEVQVRTETIKIKDTEDLVFEVKKGRHGPIVNEAIEDVALTTDEPVALWWVYNEFLPRNLEASYQLGRAQSMEQAREAVSMGHAPGLNVMYGDIDGNIAWWTMAKLPIRPDHVNSKLLLDGSSGEDEILGYVDFIDNPQSENPEIGYLYSANNQPDTTAGILHPGYYIPEDRAKRIVEILNQTDEWDMEMAKEMINDVQSPVLPVMAKEIVRLLDERYGKGLEEELEPQVLNILHNWNGDNQLDNIAPTIFAKLSYHITAFAMKDELGEVDFETMLRTHLIKRTLPILLFNDESVWWDNIETKDHIESREEIISFAFSWSMRELLLGLGDDINQWQWEKVHFIEHPHALGQVEAFRSFFNVGPFPINGNTEVLNNQMFTMTAEGRYMVKGGPAKRRIIDFSDIEHSISVLPTGQSGNFMSPHYDDQAQMFVKGEFRLQKMNEKEIKEKKSKRLKLRP